MASQNYFSPFTGDLIVPTSTSYESITLVSNAILVWPSATGINAGVTNTFYSARIIDVLPTLTNLNLALPPGGQGSVGIDILIRNLGANALFVTDSAGNNAVSIPAGASVWFYLTSNSTDVGTWRNVTFGTGASLADANSLVGGGLQVDTSANMSVAFNVIPVTTASFQLSNASIGLTYNWIVTLGVGTCNLPGGAGYPIADGWTVLVRNSGTGELTLNPPSGWTIDGAATVNLLPGESTFIIAQQSTNVNQFVTIGRNRLSNFYFSSSTQDIAGNPNIDLRQYATIIQRYRNSGTGQSTTVYLPASTNTYYLINNSGFDITFQVGATVIGNIAVLKSGNASTAVCDGTNIYATNTIPTGSLTIDSSTAATPAIKASQDTTTGVFAGVSTVGLTVAGGTKSVVTLTANQIQLSPGVTGQIVAILDGGYTS